jgi:hypothetical protein
MHANYRHVRARRVMRTTGGIRREKGKHTGGHNNNHMYGEECKTRRYDYTNQERRDQSLYRAFTTNSDLH